MTGIPPSVKPVTDPPRARLLWQWIPAGLLAAVLLVWAGAWCPARSASAAIRSLVVLPFADLTPRENNQWFAASFTGEIIDALQRIPELHVVGRTSAFKVKGAAARQVDVAAVLEGSVGQTGGRLQIALQLTRT